MRSFWKQLRETGSARYPGNVTLKTAVLNFGFFFGEGVDRVTIGIDSPGGMV
jgi:hypothetical protein